MVIAIDGPAASGKGTLAKRLAEHYRLPHLDTGLLYRAVALTLLDADRDLADADAAAAAARGLDAAFLSDPRL
ncbi:(d)CMP kinase, partial [Methylobacterium ajmalii]